MQSLKTVFKAVFGLWECFWQEEPEYEQQKEKEIEYENKTWGKR